MAKTYKVIADEKGKEIENTINELVADGWEVDKFGYAFVWREGHYWALVVKEK